jgi:outer membrane protein assembly factor BamD (BamD/ComL family)
VVSPAREPAAVQPSASPPQESVAPSPDVAAAETAEKQQELPFEELMHKALETFDEGKIPAAIALLDQLRERYPSGNDELYWLYGQFYEANSPSRDILLALDYYRRLMREYPQSGRYNDARRRVAYLERFYININ